MENSNSKDRKIASSKEGIFFLKTYPIWPKSKRFYTRRKFPESVFTDDAEFCMTEKKVEIKDSISISKMALNPNLGQVPINDLKNLRYDRNLLVEVLDLILMMIGCIIFKIDHKSRVRKKFKDVFSDMSLEILRSDLENLLRFESKSSLSWLILDLMSSQTAGELIWSETSKISTDPRKLILRRTLISVINFMIFRRSKQQIESKKKIRRFTSTLETENKWAKLKFSFLRVCIRNLGNVKHYMKVCRHLFSAIEFICKDPENLDKEENPKEMNFDMDLSEGQLNVYGEDFYACELSSESHSCSKIYCPVCYGWLWIPFYYCICVFVYPLVISLISSFTNETRFLP